MAVVGGTVNTLVDIAKRMDPDGKIARIAELLNQENEVLDDIVWKEGNLPTGDRTTVRTGLPGVAFRALNEGVPRSKSTTSQFDEAAAMLEGFSEVDRQEAILSGDIAAFRLSEQASFFEAMNQTFTSYLFYGNSSANPKAFNGFAPRFNAIAGNTTTANQIIDAGGTGTDNLSVWLVVWDENKVRGLYPKGSKAGLFHEDASDTTVASDGFPRGTVLYDPNGNPYMGYRDHYQWNCGLSIKDYRYVVRIANISRAALKADMSTGADLQDLLIQAAERVQNLNGRAAFYAPRSISTMLRRQLVKGKNGFLSWEEIGGRKVMAFDGTPLRRVDALNVNEARVV
ncbi:major capsid protein [Sphingomonas asaccharolytica]|uniref:major capsid protein n=1 Tax=Sphingomonas asaccharolytica TaxID=40681 RepID=UPI00082DC1E9|nr:hypothetical protein [Sphingomonas asaccharolytica]